MVFPVVVLRIECESRWREHFYNLLNVQSSCYVSSVFDHVPSYPVCEELGVPPVNPGGGQ